MSVAYDLKDVKGKMSLLFDDNEAADVDYASFSTA
jgi:hypothetical protein